MAFIVPTNRELNENAEELNDEKLILEKDKLKLDFIDGVSIASNPQNVSFNRNLLFFCLCIKKNYIAEKVFLSKFIFRPKLLQLNSQRIKT